MQWYQSFQGGVDDIETFSVGDNRNATESPCNLLAWVLSRAEQSNDNPRNKFRGLSLTNGCSKNQKQNPRSPLRGF
jgi:hypothetical protein